MILGHLAEATAHFALGQSGQSIEIADYRLGLPERSDEILALWQIHPSLATDRGVDHADKSCCDMHNRGASVPRSCGKAGNIRNHSATNANYNIAAGQSNPGELATEIGNYRKRFMLFAGSDVHCCRSQTCFNIETNVVLRHDYGTLRRLWNGLGEFALGAVTNDDVVGALCEIDPNALKSHRPNCYQCANARYQVRLLENH